MNRRIQNNRLARLFTYVILHFCLMTIAVNAQTNEPLISMTMRDTELAEIMEMLSRAERVNILLSDDVSGQVSFSLYDVPLSEAIRSIANASANTANNASGYIVHPPC